MEPLTEEEQKLRRFFEGQVVGAVTRRTGLVLAIEEGTTYNKNRGLDNIGEVAQWLCRATLDAPDGSAWHSTELESLVPLGEADGTGFPIVPVVGEVGRSEEDCKQAWCWALRMGYARDRVIAYARVKQAMLDVHNLSAGPELHTALFRVWDRANAGLREVELALKASRTAPRADPAAELNAMRTQWARTGEDVQNAQRQQPTLRCAPLVTGLTAREVGARAADPFLEKEETFAVGAETLALMPERDALMGTEIFVSFTFPATDHEELHAVGADVGGVRTDENERRMPALVTLHNATGALESLAICLGATKPFNVFMTHDAAALLAKLHSLIVEARRGALTMEPVPALPLAEQRNYLLLEHGTL